jgi:formylglycine-generating enzyme required for sulfatase activity
MTVHTDRPSKFFFGCLIVLLCWIIGAGQLLNRRNEPVADGTNTQFDIQQTASSEADWGVYVAPPQLPVDHGPLVFYIFVTSIVTWVSSVVGRQMVPIWREPASANDASHSIDYPAWNIFDFVVSMIILSSAGVLVGRTLGGQFTLLICVTAIVCYLLTYGPQKIANYCQSVMSWLNQRHSASMVNGDLPLGEVSWGPKTKLILPASWWQIGTHNRKARLAPIGLILFGVGVMLTFGLITLFDNLHDPTANSARSNHPPTLLSIPNTRVQPGYGAAEDQPLKPEPAPVPMQRADEPTTVTVPVSVRAPELVPLNDKTITEGEMLHVMAQVKDTSSLDGRLQFQLGTDAPHGATIDPDSGLFSWRPAAAGTYDITIAAVTDSPAPSQDETTFRVIVTPQTKPPVLARIDDRPVNEGEAIVVPVMLKSPGHPQSPLRFSLGGEVPEGAEIDPDSGVFSWTPAHPGSYPITVHCESLTSKLSDQSSFTIVVREVSEAPQLAEIGNKLVRAGESLIVPVEVRNPGRPAGQLLFAMADNSPDGTQIDPRTGVIRWDVDADAPEGEYPITVRLQNAARPQLTDQMAFQVTVLESANADRSEEQLPATLELLPINDRIVNAGSLLRFPVHVRSTGWAISELDFSLAEDAPEGASINSRTGLFTWRPADDQAGRQHWMSIQVHDVESPSRHAEARFSVQVNQVEQDSQDPVPPPHPANSFTPQDDPASEKEAVIPRFIESTTSQQITPNEPELEEGPALLPTPFQEPDANRNVTLVSDSTPEEPESVFYINSIGMHLVPIPEGVFQMGSGESAEQMGILDPSELLRFRDETPQHPVRLTQPFLMGKYEVTVGQFGQFVEQTGYKTEAERGDAGAYAYNANTHEFEWGKQFNWRNTGWAQTIDHPVVNVSWNDAVAFCHWLSEREGRIYRLPTEAEWEYACRAGSETRYSSGDAIEDLALAANLGDESFRRIIRPCYSNFVLVAGREGAAFTTAVGKFAPNAFGLHDMHGNVFEWCSDFYAATYYRESPLVDPTGPLCGTKQVIRGGSFFNSPFYSRSSFRNGFPPSSRVPYLGFRVVMESEDLLRDEVQPQPSAEGTVQN